VNVSGAETKGTALITGASGGIGAIYADRLAKRGYDLIPVARNRGRRAALARRLKNETGRSVETIAADLNDKADLARIETTLRTNASITPLVNNSGVGATAPLLDSNVEKMVTYAAAPGFVARVGDIVVNIASSVATSPATLQGKIVTIPSLPVRGSAPRDVRQDLAAGSAVPLLPTVPTAAAAQRSSSAVQRARTTNVLQRSSRMKLWGES
jgi:NADP-dependent 3-hydroxy acid dehydrogenase YdfG